jgi:hypothetical protein
MTEPSKTPAKAKRHHCWYCGEDMGPWDRNCDSRDTCGKQECERAARDQDRAEYEEAHERLDLDMGWDRW